MNAAEQLPGESRASWKDRTFAEHYGAGAHRLSLKTSSDPLTDADRERLAAQASLYLYATHERTPRMTRTPADAFREAWHKADAEGLTGQRVEAGLEAAMAPLIAERDALAAKIDRAKRIADDPCATVSSRLRRVSEALA